VHQTQLRHWVKHLTGDPQHSLPGHGQMKPEQAEIARLKRELAKLKAERDILKSSRGLLREREPVKFSFVAKHRGIWPVGWMCGALGGSRGGFYAWLTRPRSRHSRSDEDLGAKVKASFLASDRTYGARRVWRDVPEGGMSCGLHRIERLMLQQALRARPRRRRLPIGAGERSTSAVSPNVLDRTVHASSANRKWVADFTSISGPPRAGSTWRLWSICSLDA
jgi:putative transposase